MSYVRMAKEAGEIKAGDCAQNELYEGADFCSFL